MNRKVAYYLYTLKNRMTVGKRRGVRLFEYLPHKYGKVLLCDAEQIHLLIADKIRGGDPFALSRFGTTELQCLKAFHFSLKPEIRQGVMGMMMNFSGFFPADVKYGEKFHDLMLESVCEIDIQGVWFKSCEDYLMNKGSVQACTYMFNNEPWRVPENPWSRELKGKKVLVIHPFVETIKSQYNKRMYLFENTDILPEFDLLTLKAVQTIAGNKDERFSDWFEALDWMYQEALKQEFDIAILGCGAYGYPLAAMLKKAGKQVIHLGGATQGLFGIRCKRFDEDPEYEGLRKFYNENWVYPDIAEMPKNYKKVEGGCYWK